MHNLKGEPRPSSRGFTMIELLAVVVIIAILVTISAGKFGQSKRNSYITAMKSDLRNLATIAETTYAADNQYTALVAPTPSNGVKLEVTASRNEWSATATHDNVKDIVCTIASTDPNVQPRPMPDCR